MAAPRTGGETKSMDGVGRNQGIFLTVRFYGNHLQGLPLIQPLVELDKIIDAFVASAMKIGLHTGHCCPLRILWEVAFTGTMIFYFVTGYILLANHGVKIEDLTRVLSHPQCEHTLTRLRVAREAVDDIAGPARVSSAMIIYALGSLIFDNVVPKPAYVALRLCESSEIVGVFYAHWCRGVRDFGEAGGGLRW
ncbi:hypothetical protein Tco_1252285 [Tanacetum coccineum]